MTEPTPDPPEPQAHHTTPPRVIDNPVAPDLFADSAIGFSLRNGVVSITLSSQRVDHTEAPAAINNVVIARLVMPVFGAQHLILGLYDFLKTHGLDPIQRPPEQPVQ